MDLISTEAQFLLDEQGAPAAIFPRVTGEAEGMIEQFMIAANVAVAALARQRKLPFVYRIHENPSPEKLALLMDAVRLLGLKTPLPTSEPAQTVLRELMEEARQTPYARLISERLLRSMAKAKYSENPLGHYGLALQDYCHFTSADPPVSGSGHPPDFIGLSGAYSQGGPVRAVRRFCPNGGRQLHRLRNPRHDRGAGM